MKRILLTTCTAAFLFVACNSDKKAEEKTASETETSADSKDKMENKKEEAWVPIDSATMEKAWMEFMAVGEPHKMLAKANGNWKGEVSMWMAEGAPPMTSIATTVNSTILGGRYQQSKHNGTFMGQPFEGMSIMGYDNAKKEYVSSWVDNMGTGIMNTSGKWDDASKSIMLNGTYINPANGKECKIREVFKIIDDNNQVLEMYGPDSQTGKEMKTMEIKYTRKK